MNTTTFTPNPATFEIFNEDDKVFIRRNRYPRFVGEITYGKSIIENIKWQDPPLTKVHENDAIGTAEDFLKNPDTYKQEDLKPIFNDDAKYPNFFYANNHVDRGGDFFIIHTSFPRVIIVLTDEAIHHKATYEDFVKGATPYWQDTPHSDTQREEMMITASNFLKANYENLFPLLAKSLNDPQLAEDLEDLRDLREKKKEDNQKE